MATLTIIKDDGFVSVDGVGYTGLDCSSLDSNVHAVQFDGTNGHVEYKDSTANLDIDSISSYSTIVNVHTAKTTAIATANAEAASAQTALEATYSWKRINDETTQYASVGDQLDQQYKDLLNGTTTWKDGIAAVKTAHPKP